MVFHCHLFPLTTNDFDIKLEVQDFYSIFAEDEMNVYRL